MILEMKENVSGNLQVKFLKIMYYILEVKRMIYVL